MIEAENNSEDNKIQPNECVQFGGAIYLVTSVEGDHASLMNVMDHGDRAEAVPLSSLKKGGFGSETLPGTEKKERNIRLADTAAFENYLLGTPEDVQKCVAMLTNNIIEAKKNKFNKMPEFFSLECNLVTDNDGEIYAIDEFDEEGVDLMNLRTGDTFPYDYETFKQLFTLYNNKKKNN